MFKVESLEVVKKQIKKPMF